jgi:hypothetical protein
MESLSRSKRGNPVQREGFTDIGYYSYNLKFHIDEKEMAALNKLATKYKTKPIFNQEIQTGSTDKNKKFDNDNKRSASNPIQNFKNPTIVETMRVVNQYAQIGNPTYEIQRAVFLRSEAGCLLQAEHTDGTPTTGNFCSCILAIQEGTKIIMDGRTIYLNVGEAIFFHSDVSHQGCDYKKANSRLFFYIAEKKGDIPKDGVGDLRPTYCDYCNNLLYLESKYDHDEVDDTEYALEEKNVIRRKKDVKKNHKRGCEGQHSPEKLALLAERSRLQKQKSRANQKQRKLIGDKVDDQSMDGAVLSVSTPVEDIKMKEK